MLPPDNTEPQESDAIEPLEENPPKRLDPDVLDSSSPETEEEVQIERVLQRVLAWSAPLPAPEWLHQYDRDNPGASEIILRDFERRSELHAQAFDHEREMDLRAMALQEREQEDRHVGLLSDIDHRREVFRFARWYLVLLPILAFIVLMWGPEGWVRAAGAGLFMAPIVILGVVIFLRGRMSTEETDVLKTILPYLPKDNNDRGGQPQSPPMRQTRLPFDIEGSTSEDGKPEPESET